MSSESGLFSKFTVTKPSGEPLGTGSFCLVPFNKDGTVRDQNAIYALRAYASAAGGAVADGIMDWLGHPTKYHWLNNPATPERKQQEEK